MHCSQFEADLIVPIKLSIVCARGIQMNTPVFPSMFLFGSIS